VKLKFTFVKKATWPFNRHRGEIEDRLKIIDVFKRNVLFAITADSMEIMVGMEEKLDTVGTSINIVDAKVVRVDEKVEHVTKQINEMVISQEDKAILNWLDVVNSYDNHDSAREKHLDATGEWFVNSEEFKRWKEATNGAMWLHGIPGAGKTILCSTIIENVKEFCSSQPNERYYAYFYFDFKAPTKRKVDSMLRSVIAQLCTQRGKVPSDIRELFHACGSGRREPSVRQLIANPLLLFGKSHHTFLILDALDEIPRSEEEGDERKKLLQAIKELLTDHSGQANILVTSRTERDVVDALEPLMGGIDVDAAKIAGDIKSYIQHYLKNERSFQKWQEETRETIQTALLDGARGM